ncbi:MAG: hypothetical protein OIF47_15650 [Marinibacterium sp.]|nr:hypothetical protein [Marinibacterium sp.]
MTADKVVIFTADADALPVGRPTSARGGPGSDRLAQAVEVSTDLMERNVAAFVENVSSMIEAANAAAVGDVALDTVEIAVQIGADGKVGFMGVGVGAKATSSMKIVFRRQV